MKRDSVQPAGKASTLSLPILRRWEASGREVLVESTANRHTDHFLSVDGKRIITCRQIADGAVRWRQPLPFAAVWTETQAEVIIIAGPDGVAGLMRKTGRQLWHFPSPALVSQRVQLRGEQPVLLRDGTGLAGFHLGNGKIIFCSDDRRLFCLDVLTGRTLWSLWAPSAPIRPRVGGGKFQPNFLITAERVLIQTNHGKRWLLDAATGRKIAEADCSVSFSPPPLLLEQDRKACLSLEAGVIVMLDLYNGKEIWRFRHPWRTSLTGEPARLLEQDGMLWAVIPLNYGQEIWRLDIAHGKAVWPEPILLPGPGSGWCAARVAASSYWTTACNAGA